MALREDQIIDFFNDACRETFNGLERFRYFARTVEAEVRKDDEALIRQMVDALEGSIAITMVKIDLRNAALIAGRARLEGKP